MAKRVNGAAMATLFDGDSEIGDLEGGVYVRRYVPGPGIDAPDVRFRRLPPDGTARWEGLVLSYPAVCQTMADGGLT